MKKLKNTDAIRVGAGGNSPLGRFLDHNIHYQDLLADIIRRERPLVVVETGVESGFSSEHFLVALDDNKSGHLYSCDPAPSGFYDANPIVHPRFTFLRERSYTALDKIWAETGRIDLFLHDSDHSYECQTYEYEFAWAHVKKGGIIATDDPGWHIVPQPGLPQEPHGAWDNFLARHHCTGLDVKINNGRWFRKPC
jgi:predicted O-methyltransferase YrrM